MAQQAKLKARSSNINCCVVNCKNTYKNSTNIKFYSFPVIQHKRERRKQWVRAVNRINEDGSIWEPKKYSRICSSHFVDNEKSEDPRSPSYNPTIFPQVCESVNVNEVTQQKSYSRLKARKASKPTETIEIKKENFEFESEITLEPETELMDFKMEPIDFQTEPMDFKTEYIIPEEIIRNREIQTEFDDEYPATEIKLFICNRYVKSVPIGAEIKTTCEAEVQVFIPKYPEVKIKTELPTEINGYA